MKNFRKLLKYMKPYLAWAVIGPLFMLLEVAMDLSQPRIMQNIVDNGIMNSDLSLIFRMGAVMFGVAIAGLVGGIGCTIFSTRASISMSADIRDDLYRKVQSLSFGNLDRLEAGSIITRLTGDVIQIQEISLMMLRILVRAPFLMIGSLVMAIITSIELSIILVVIIPVIIITTILIVNKAFPLFRSVQKKLDNLNTVVQENLSGIRVVRAFVREEYEKKRFKKVNNSYMDLFTKAARITAAIMPIMIFIVNAAIAYVLWFGGVEAIDGNIQLGQLIAFINYLMQLLMSIMMVGMLIVRLSQGEASAARIYELLNEKPDIKETGREEKTKAGKGSLEFRNVSFSYNHMEKSEPVLKNISFKLEPGKIMALTGPTGSGKTSLINLIPRFYDITEGKILFNENNICEMNIHDLRKRIGLVPQKTILFSGSLRNNITYGKEESEHDEVVRAAETAQINEFIMNNDSGYDSLIGQRGVNLSGGQKQRISIARALITNPEILILDDSTSALDTVTVSKFIKALSEYRRGKTTIIITQKIKSIKNADMILVLENGEITGKGTHEELLNSNSFYTDIYFSQEGELS
jgi:ATP-binding cassette, subfamily B, multidrug efflux pump